MPNVIADGSVEPCPDMVHLTSELSSDVEVNGLFPGEPVARYLEAVTAGNIRIKTAMAGVERTLPFTAGQSRVVKFTHIIASGTTCTGVIVGV